MRGIAIRAGIAAIVAIAAFGILVAVLNATVLSASGYVESYLAALQRQDAATALELAGEPPATSRRTDLLVDAAIVPVNATEVTAGEEVNGVTPVDVAFEVDGRSAITTFSLQRTGALFGIFSTWGFVESPLSTVEITVMHTTEFTANGIALRTPEQDRPVRYLVFSPGFLTLEHESSLLVAAPETVLVDSASTRAQLNAEASESFVAQVQTEVDAYLAQCASQQVLMPSGCPFGQPMADRIVSPPAWSIVSSPVIALDPTSTPGVWTTPTAPGVARLVVDVKSIYDGDVDTFDEPVTFSVGFTVTFVGAREIELTPRFASQG